MVTPVLMSRKPRKELRGRSLHSGRSVSLIWNDRVHRVVADMQCELKEKTKRRRGRGRKRGGDGQQSDRLCGPR